MRALPRIPSSSSRAHRELVAWRLHQPALLGPHPASPSLVHSDTDSSLQPRLPAWPSMARVSRAVGPCVWPSVPLNAKPCQGHMLSGKRHCSLGTSLLRTDRGSCRGGTCHRRDPRWDLCACRPGPQHRRDPPPSSWFSSVLWTPHPSAASTKGGSVLVPKALW